MTPAERISFLVSYLEKGNATAFAEKCGIHPAALSRIRNDKYPAKTYYGRILTTYPEIRKSWLLEGEGEPFLVKSDDSILSEIKALRREVARLSELIEKMGAKG